MTRKATAEGLAFAKRLTQAMRRKGAPFWDGDAGKPVRQQIADALGVSVQAIGQTLNGLSGFDAANTIRAGRALSCNPYWLATGEEQPELGASTPAETTTAAIRVELDGAELDEDTLTLPELQDLLASVIELPLPKARELLAQLMMDAEGYRETAQRALRRFGATGVVTNERAAETLPSAANLPPPVPPNQTAPSNNVSAIPSNPRKPNRKSSRKVADLSGKSSTQKDVQRVTAKKAR